MTAVAAEPPAPPPPTPPPHPEPHPSGVTSSVTSARGWSLAQEAAGVEVKVVAAAAAVAGLRGTNRSARTAAS